MLNPKHQRYADRIRELIEEGKTVARLERSSQLGYAYIQDEDQIRVHAWLANAENILVTVFGRESSHLTHFREALPRGGIGHVSSSCHIHPLNGVLSGALDDLEKGFLIGQEFIIAGEILDSVLEQAKYLNKSGHKDPAAMLVRVALEDALKRIARSEGIDDNRKASMINDDLKRHNVYPQPQWRFIQAWLDIGNSAAHGNFDAYSVEDVIKMIEGVEQFLIFRFG